MIASRSWVPILTDADAERAATLALGIARELPSVLPPSADTSPALASGTAGAALLYYYGARAFPPHADELLSLAVRYRDAASEAAETRTLDLSLFGGLTGLAWLNEHVSEPGDDDANDEFEAFLHSTLEQRWSSHYDSVFGLVGHGVYACERAARGRDSSLALVIERLAERATTIDGAATWFTPRELLPDSQLAYGPNGYYNLGLAHGVPGVVALLARVVLAGHANARPLLAAATRWLVAQGAPPTESRASMYGFVVDPAHANARAGWCYGDPGVGIALLAASDALDDAHVRAVAIDVLLAAAARSTASAEVVDAPLCHGAGGLALIFARAAQTTGDERLLAAARRWAHELLRFHRPGEGIAGFTAMSATPHGLVSGVAGVGLALIALGTAVEPAWDRCLLIGR